MAYNPGKKMENNREGFPKLPKLPDEASIHRARSGRGRRAPVSLPAPPPALTDRDAPPPADTDLPARVRIHAADLPPAVAALPAPLRTACLIYIEATPEARAALDRAITGEDLLLLRPLPGSSERCLDIGLTRRALLRMLAIDGRSVAQVMVALGLAPDATLARTRILAALSEIATQLALHLHEIDGTRRISRAAPPRPVRIPPATAR